MTRQYDNYADLITFSRSSSGTALRPISYGTELVTNGTFDSDISGWTDISTGTADISYLSGTLSLNTINTSNRGQAEQAITTQAGGVYFYTFTVTATAYIKIGTTSQGTNIVGATQYTAGTHTVSFVALSNSTYLTFYSISNTTTLDNISVKEVLFDQPNAPLTLFNHPAGIPRIEYDADGNVLGLLVEESRTNLVEYSNDFANAYWSKSGTGVSVPVITANSEVSLDGTQNADKVEFPAVSTVDTFSLVTKTFSSRAAGTYTFSVYLKGQNGGETVYLTLSNAVPTTSTECVLTTEWQRFDITTTIATTATLYTNIGIDLRDPSESGQTAQTVYFYEALFELGSFPTSAIPTAGATATRSADVASIPVADFGYNQSEGSWLMEWDTADTDSVVAKYILSSGTSARVMYNNAGTSAYYSFDGSAVSTYTAPTPITLDGSLIKAAYAENESGSSVAHTGVLGTGSVNSDLLPNYNSTYGWSIGNLNNNQGFLNGHIKSIKYFPRKLTAAQLQELTS